MPYSLKATAVTNTSSRALESLLDSNQLSRGELDMSIPAGGQRLTKGRLSRDLGGGGTAGSGEKVLYVPCFLEAAGVTNTGSTAPENLL